METRRCSLVSLLLDQSWVYEVVGFVAIAEIFWIQNPRKIVYDGIDTATLNISTALSIIVQHCIQFTVTIDVLTSVPNHLDVFSKADGIPRIAVSTMSFIIVNHICFIQ